MPKATALDNQPGWARTEGPVCAGEVTVVPGACFVIKSATCLATRWLGAIMVVGHC